MSGAIQVLKLNIELYPTSAFSYARLAGIYEAEGNSAAAVENYEQALKLDPNNRMAKGRLERLQGNK
jgi:Tfp pilus assembly protein PilF